MAVDFSGDTDPTAQTQVSPVRGDISDLTNEIAHGRTMAETASFLCRAKTSLWQKARELGLSISLTSIRKIGTRFDPAYIVQLIKYSRLFDAGYVIVRR